MTVLVQIPQRTLQPGVYDVPAQVVPVGSTEIGVTIEPVSWPNTPTTICQATADVSRDGGATWEPAIVQTMSGGPFESDDLANGIYSGFALYPAADSQTRVRGRWEQFQRVRVGARLEAFTR